MSIFPDFSHFHAARAAYENGIAKGRAEGAAEVERVTAYAEGLTRAIHDVVTEADALIGVHHSDRQVQESRLTNALTLVRAALAQRPMGNAARSPADPGTAQAEGVTAGETASIPAQSRSRCDSNEFWFNSGDYYISCAKCGQKWALVGEQPEYGTSDDFPSIGRRIPVGANPALQGKHVPEVYRVGDATLRRQSERDGNEGRS